MNRYSKQNNRSIRYKRLGYRDFVVINGKQLRLDVASKEFPIEVFQQIDSKQIYVGERIYMNLLDCLKAMNHPLYFSHRKPYHDKVVEKVKTQQRRDLISVVNSCLVSKNIDKLEVKHKINSNKTTTRTYRSTMSKCSSVFHEYGLHKPSNDYGIYKIGNKICSVICLTSVKTNSK